MIKGVILDIGGVVLPYAELEEPHDQKWERLLNQGPGSIAKRIWSHDNAKRAGTGQMQYSEFQRWIGKELGLGSELLRQWHESQWASVEFDPLIADWIQSLRKRVRIAFCSNTWSDDRRELNARFGLQALADVMVLSGEEGISKPDPRIYQVTLDRLDLAAQDTVFVDDRSENVEAAVLIGMQGVVRQATDQMMHDVEELVFADRGQGKG
jgi:putative hydrolase of the HAD superfamily